MLRMFLVREGKLTISQIKNTLYTDIYNQAVIHKIVSNNFQSLISSTKLEKIERARRIIYQKYLEKFNQS